jgi:hypothetical protein
MIGIFKTLLGRCDKHDEWFGCRKCDEALTRILLAVREDEEVAASPKPSPVRADLKRMSELGLYQPDTAKWQVKVWGATRCVAKGPAFEVWDLMINRGGYCSRHYHRKWNMFLVLHGDLEVQSYAADPATRALTWLGCRKLRGGINGQDILNVAPGTIHRFVAHTECQVLEVYWTDEIDPADIVRYDEGGMQ